MSDHQELRAAQKELKEAVSAVVRSIEAICDSNTSSAETAYTANALRGFLFRIQELVLIIHQSSGNLADEKARKITGLP